MDMVEFAESTWTHWELLPGCRDNWAADYIEIMTIVCALYAGCRDVGNDGSGSTENDGVDAEEARCRVAST